MKTAIAVVAIWAVVAIGAALTLRAGIESFAATLGV